MHNTKAGYCFAPAASVSVKGPRKSFARRSRVCPATACHHAPDSKPRTEMLSRRVVLSMLVASAVGAAISKAQAAQSEQTEENSYDAIRTRRHVGIGRFPPDRPAPAFEPGKKLFQVNAGLEAQDVKFGQGDISVKPGSLVVARWAMVLEDGSTVDAANENQAAIFRPGAHQVPSGIEDSVIGMRPGGKRLVKGTSERILA